MNKSTTRIFLTFFCNSLIYNSCFSADSLWSLATHAVTKAQRQYKGHCAAALDSLPKKDFDFSKIDRDKKGCFLREIERGLEDRNAPLEMLGKLYNRVIQYNLPVSPFFLEIAASKISEKQLIKAPQLNDPISLFEQSVQMMILPDDIKTQADVALKSANDNEDIEQIIRILEICKQKKIKLDPFAARRAKIVFDANNQELINRIVEIQELRVQRHEQKKLLYLHTPRTNEDSEDSDGDQVVTDPHDDNALIKAAESPMPETLLVDVREISPANEPLSLSGSSDTPPTDKKLAMKSSAAAVATLERAVVAVKKAGVKKRDSAAEQAKILATGPKKSTVKKSAIRQPTDSPTK